jgi:uncharacterized RDD family membrane protein YckC
MLVSVEATHGIVTPEAVVLEFETAGVGSRALPCLFDLFIQLVLLIALSMGLSALAGPFGAPSTFVVVVTIALTFGVVIGYPIVMEAFFEGRTIGKMLFGLRVVTKEGAPIRFRHSALRGVLRFFEIIILVGAPAILSATFSRDSQRLGDLVGGTIVIRERTGETVADVVTFPPPPGYEQYVASLDVSGLTAEQYGMIRSFLLRTAQLTAEARAVVAVRLANPVALRLSHTPPPMLNPELFLVSVAAAYQLRHGSGGATVPWSPDPAWAASQMSGGVWTGTSPAWVGAGPGSGPAPGPSAPWSGPVASPPPLPSPALQSPAPPPAVPPAIKSPTRIDRPESPASPG